MDNELKFHLEQGPTSVKELARLTGKSTSTIYKALKDENVLSQDSTEGKRFFMRPETAPETNSNGVEGEKTAPPQETPAPAPAAPSGKRGRKPTAQGQQLYPDASLLSNDSETGAGTHNNPRRKNSNGYRSLQIIIDHPGITAEDYVTKGGRLNDLRWDLAHGNVRAE